MPRKFTHVLKYSAPAVDVHNAITDEQLWRSLFERADTATLDVESPDGPGTATISMSEGVRKEKIPALVRKVVKGDLTLSRTDRWGSFDGDRATGTLSCSSTGLPGSIAGTYTLRDTTSGAVIDVAAETDVKVRFVGGAIEALVDQLFTKMLENERKFVEKWITARTER